jgi:CheY-like chemotaxis protein/preprotein translocase subunit YajC
MSISIILIILVIILGLYIFITRKSNKEEEDFNETQKIANEIKEKQVKSSNLMSGKGVAKNSGGIIKEKVNKSTGVTDLKKPVAWQETSSYEEDVKKVDLNAITKNDSEKNKTKVIEEKTVKFTNPLVLLVDDSMVVRKYVGDLLKKNNYDVVLKNDGGEAITYLNSNSQKPDLIISDIEMPNMNGFQLIDAIRKEKKYKNVPILVISAHAESHLVLMESENIQGFIKKPFEDIDLLNQVLFLIKGD